MTRRRQSCQEPGEEVLGGGSAPEMPGQICKAPKESLAELKLGLEKREW